MHKPDCLTKKTNELCKWISIKVGIAFLRFGIRIAKIFTYQGNCKNVLKYKKSENYHRKHQRIFNAVTKTQKSNARLRGVKKETFFMF